MTWLVKRLFHIPLFFSRQRESARSKLVGSPVVTRGSEWYVNERIVELAYISSHLGYDGLGKRVLDFGCARSHLAIQLASLGFDVVGVDLRPYALAHPRLDVFEGDILSFADDIGFDWITCVSVLEHVGCGAYGDVRSGNKREVVARKLVSLLKPGANLLVTVPCGLPHQEEFFSSLTPDEVRALFQSPQTTLMESRFFKRLDFKHWQPCGEREVVGMSNSTRDRGPTGVNAIGCFAWRKDGPSRA